MYRLYYRVLMLTSIFVNNIFFNKLYCFPNLNYEFNTQTSSFSAFTYAINLWSNETLCSSSAGLEITVVFAKYNKWSTNPKRNFVRDDTRRVSRHFVWLQQHFVLVVLEMRCFNNLHLQFNKHPASYRFLEYLIKTIS